MLKILASLMVAGTMFAGPATSADLLVDRSGSMNFTRTERYKQIVGSSHPDSRGYAMQNLLQAGLDRVREEYWPNIVVWGEGIDQLVSIGPSETGSNVLLLPDAPAKKTYLAKTLRDLVEIDRDRGAPCGHYVFTLDQEKPDDFASMAEQLLFAFDNHIMVTILVLKYSETADRRVLEFSALQAHRYFSVEVLTSEALTRALEAPVISCPVA